MTVSILKASNFKFELIIIVLIVFLHTSCSKKKAANDLELKPQKANLIYPNANEACLSGKVISSTKSEINFSWSAALKTESYELNIKNLLSGEIIKKNTAALTLAVELDRNVPYLWFVVSKNSYNTTESESWKFYNAGINTTYYAPFPADQLIPTLGQVVTISNGKVTLDWEASDVDNDLAFFDIYFGTSSNPPIYKTGVTESKLLGVPIDASKSYYWKIITKDSKGNGSDSGIYHFLVN